MIRKECAAAGFFSEVSENFVAFGEVRLAIGELVGIGLRELNPLGAGADGVNDDAVALRHFDGFGARVRREVVVAIADDDHDAANDVGLVAGRTRRMAQFFFAGVENRVVDRGAATGAGLDDLVAQTAGIIGEALKDGGFVVESHDEGLIFVAAQDGEQERSSGVLFEFEAVANAVGSVEQEADAEREIGLLAEIANGLGNLVVGNFEVVFLEVGDELVAAIENGEEDVNEVDGLYDARLVGLVCGSLLLRRRRRRGRLRHIGSDAAKSEDQRKNAGGQCATHGWLDDYR